jgi:putative hydrolase
MEPVEALERISELLHRVRNARPKVAAFRRAADAIRDIPPDELRALAAGGRLTDIPGIGASTAAVISQALAGETPEYLTKLAGDTEPPTDLASPVQTRLRGDLHLHSDWSDGGHALEAMAQAARELGHEYLAITDHSPLVRVANGLDAGRLATQLDTIAALNEELAPFRLLSGMEVDIRDDGSLDMADEMLERLDVVVASVHSHLDMESKAMTQRMVTALASPHTDILGHCTGRLIVGRGRAESTFDAELVFAAAAHLNKAVEVNSRPERLDPPRRLLPLLDESGALLSIDSDAHATWQLEWQPYGAHRVAQAGIDVDRVVNTWPVDDLLAWTASHAAAA